MGSVTLRRISDLTRSTNAQDLISHHRYVLDYFSKEDGKATTGFNFLRGDQLTPAEKDEYKKRNKVPMTFNTLKSSERAILGNFIAAKVDMKWAPQKPTDQDLATVMESLRIWEANKNGDAYNDVDLIRQAWAGKGASYQECFVDVAPGKEPQIRTNPLNPFYVHFDPESRMPITREDAQFVDIDSFHTIEQLVEAFPIAKEIFEKGEQSTLTNADSYERTVDQYKDRDAQTKVERNGKYKVVERYYRVRKSYFYVIEPNDPEVTGNYTKRVIPEEDLETYKKQNPESKVQNDYQEELWLAVVCEGLSNTNYLFNGKYHCQVLNPYINRVMWPVVEMVAESLNGDPSSFLEHEILPQKMLNSMINSLYHSAKHSGSQAQLIDVSAFVDEQEAINAQRYHADSDRGFRVKKGMADNAMRPITRGSVSSDVINSLQYAKEHIDEVSATPPAMQGQKEGNETGVLYAQRIEQAQSQLQVMFANYRKFVEQRTLLRYMYQVKYYTAEMTFRVVDLEMLKGSSMEGEEFITINQKRPAVDEFGYIIPGKMTMTNAINSVLFDLTAEESTKSPNFRTKIMGQIIEMANAPAVQNDPVLMAYLFQAYIQQTDLPSNLKDQISQRSSVLEQHDQMEMQAKQQAQQMQQAQMQQMEAQQQQAQADAQRQQVEDQKDMMSLQSDMRKQELEEKKLMLEAQKLGIDKMLADIDVQEAQTTRGNALLDLQIKQKDVELMDLEADSMELSNMAQRQAIAQTQADETGLTVMDLKEDGKVARDAAIQEANRGREQSPNPQGAK